MEPQRMLRVARILSRPFKTCCLPQPAGDSGSRSTRLQSIPSMHPQPAQPSSQGSTQAQRAQHAQQAQQGTHLASSTRLGCPTPMRLSRMNPSSRNESCVCVEEGDTFDNFKTHSFRSRDSKGHGECAVYATPPVASVQTHATPALDLPAVESCPLVDESSMAPPQLAMTNPQHATTHAQCAPPPSS